MNSKVKTKAMTSQEIKDMLDSDDELSDFYDEAPDLPAFENHSRFETIQFPWMEEKLNQLNINETDKQIQKTTSNAENVEEKQVETKQELPASFVLSDNLFLSERDIYFIKSIEKFASDSTLIWFIPFLTSKSNKYIRRSCLIQDFY